jgi:hypothetical protein
MSCFQTAVLLFVVLDVFFVQPQSLAAMLSMRIYSAQ